MKNWFIFALVDLVIWPLILKYKCSEAWVLSWNAMVQFPITCRKECKLETLIWYMISDFDNCFKPKKWNSIRFCVDKTFFVAGYGPDLTEEVEVNIGQKYSPHETILREKLQKISGDRSCNISQVLFDCPVCIKANMYYTYFMVNWAHFTNLTSIWQGYHLNDEFDDLLATVVWCVQVNVKLHVKFYIRHKLQIGFSGRSLWSSVSGQCELTWQAWYSGQPGKCH